MKTKTHTVNIRPVLITLLALTFSISSIAWLNPEIKNGKVIIKNAPAIRMVTATLTGTPGPVDVPPAPPAAPKHRHKLMVKNPADTSQLVDLDDTTRFMNLNDTSKHKKYKIVVEDDNGVKTEYNSVNDLPAGDKEDFYNSDQWKHQTELMTKQTEKFAKQFNSPKFKKHLEAMTKYYDSPKFKKQIEAMTKQYDSPKFKKQIEDMTKYYDSPEFQKSVEDMTKQYDSPEFKKQIEDMTKYYDSPEFQKSVEDMAAGYAEIGKSFGDVGMNQADKAAQSKASKVAREDAIQAKKDAKQAKVDRPIAIKDSKQAKIDGAQAKKDAKQAKLDAIEAKKASEEAKKAQGDDKKSSDNNQPL